MGGFNWREGRSAEELYPGNISQKPPCVLSTRAAEGLRPYTRPLCRESPWHCACSLQCSLVKKEKKDLICEFYF
jgi:hypothetical protein